VQADPDSGGAETNSTGSPPLVCSATVHSEVLSNGYLGKTPFLSAPDRQFSRNRAFRSQHAVSGQLGGWATSPVGPFRSSREGGFRQMAAWLWGSCRTIRLDMD
jgi:hypothetical protein